MESKDGLRLGRWWRGLASAAQVSSMPSLRKRPSCGGFRGSAPPALMLTCRPHRAFTAMELFGAL